MVTEIADIVTTAVTCRQKNKLSGVLGVLTRPGWRHRAVDLEEMGTESQRHAVPGRSSFRLHPYSLI